jgi:hypothetical protein
MSKPPRRKKTGFEQQMKNVDPHVLEADDKLAAETFEQLVTEGFKPGMMYELQMLKLQIEESMNKKKVKIK